MVVVDEEVEGAEETAEEDKKEKERKELRDIGEKEERKWEAECGGGGGCESQRWKI